MNVPMVSTELGMNGNADTATGAEVESAQEGRALISLVREQTARWFAVADASPIGEFYDGFVRQCFSLAGRMLDQPGVAEQATQEACVKLSICPVVYPDNYPESYPPREGSFQGWLLSVTHNKCLAELRLLRLRHPEVALEAVEQSLAGNLVDIMVDAALSATDLKLLREGQPPLHQVVGQLASAQRQVLELAYFGGLSQAEIAFKLRQPLGTVKSHTRMALRKLQALSRLSS
jgi:RNA polymerase sigma-70 factor, ECF subfamily